MSPPPRRRIVDVVGENEVRPTGGTDHDELQD
jgi:hypothetical protein